MSWDLLENHGNLFNSDFIQFGLGKINQFFPSKWLNLPVPFAANKPIKANAVNDLPEPLSPTIPSVLYREREV